MADQTAQDARDARGERGGEGHRKAFVVGTVIGAGAGVVSAFLNAPRSGRATRAQLQQGIEGVLFKVLDMRPSRLGGPTAATLPTATITELTPAAPPMVAASDAPAVPDDILIDARPSDLHA